MTGWIEHKGPAVALDVDCVDTDQLIPARFMSTPRGDGYGDFLLHDMRADSHGVPDPDFCINRHPDATILVGRRNFGSGSSREAAVYALVDFGIRVVISPSFGDIFASNAVNNGLVPARVDEKDAERLFKMIGNAKSALAVNIAGRTITAGEQTIPFKLSDAWVEKLINGWDDIDLTERHRPAISAFRSKRADMRPWVLTDRLPSDGVP